MKSLLLFACLTALPMLAAPQQFQLNLDSVAAKASEHVDVSLNAATLQFAAKFLDANDPDDAKVKKLIEGIEGIYVRHYKFKSAGAWTQGRPGADSRPVARAGVVEKSSARPVPKTARIRSLAAPLPATNPSGWRSSLPSQTR